MKLELDDYERDLMIETIQHRLDTDKLLILNASVKDDLVDLLRKLEDEYL